MLDYIDKIKEISERLLKDCSVEMVIGFRKGTLPMMNEPCFAKTPEDVDSFVWDSNCGINLANYLTNRSIKVYKGWAEAQEIAEHRDPAWEPPVKVELP